MKRRKLLQNLLVVSGGLVSLPAWADSWSPEDFNISSFFSSAEKEIMSAVADTYIPGGKDPGALSTGVDKFLVRLFEECYEPAVQDNIRQGLTWLNTQASLKYQKGFAQCDQGQRESLITDVSTSEEKNLKDFQSLVKSETIRGYSTSKTVMVTYLKYKVVPGHYHGCVTVKS